MNKIGKRISYLSNRNSAYVTKSLKEENLTYNECRVIVNLYDNKTMSQNELAKKLNIDKSLVTRIIKSMIEKDYISYSIDLEDNRIKLITLTDKSKKKFNKIRETFNKSSSKLVSGLNDQEINTLIVLLDKMIDGVKGGKNNE